MLGGGGKLCLLELGLYPKSVKSKLKMKTLAQMRNGVLKKLNKKRKLEFSSLVVSPGKQLLKQSDQKRKAESIRRRLIHKPDVSKGHRVDSSKKKSCEESRGDRSLCSSSKGKNDSGGSQSVSLKRMRKQKRKKDKVALDEAAQLQRRARYLLVKMKLEQSLIDAYVGEGWKGQSREKIKPEKELQRAMNQILKCKLGIRDTIHQLDLLASVGKIDDSLISPDGSVHHEHIFCKKCKSQDVSEDNDIILCDGTCNCAFHQKCIDPPLATIDIPPEDEGWFCKYCDSKMEILEATNAHLGTQFSADSTWQDIFKEEANLSGVGTRDLHPEEEWPDDESDDNDYDPDRDENDTSNWCGMEDSDSHEKSSTSSSCCSLESEVLSESGFSGRDGVFSDIASLHQKCATVSNENECTSGPRKRCAVDYIKLYDEMFGKDTTTGDMVSEDEDWGPSKRRRREKESDVASTLMTLCESEAKHSDLQNLEVGNNHLPFAKAKKPLSRIPSDAVQKLRQAFSENELPSRDFKKNLSELVGLEYAKVNKWFKNARYMALKNKKRERGLDHSPKKSDTEIGKTTEVVSNCSSPPILIHTKKRLKKVSWKANLTSLLSPSKKQKLMKASLGCTKANTELSDDMSLKKHLLYLKAKSGQNKRVKRKTEPLQRQSAEKLMEHVCWIEAKIQKLKQTLSTIQKVTNNEPDDLSLTKEKVVYVPIADLKEKPQC
ncbi:pathogenesis-related homeodomain protein-like [Chenopodium quinoa]|uniref:pathogenesis-related homeodomain protein-like n=1 Tax=Chenopodium quinoa TaxID=63459 RepID=UPI000B792D30|nr:pathogenesis-related homeodomain protein-like [Chenopodium quinoa]